MRVISVGETVEDPTDGARGVVVSVAYVYHAGLGDYRTIYRVKWPTGECGYTIDEFAALNRVAA